MRVTDPDQGPFGNFWSLYDNCGFLSCLGWSKPHGFWNKNPDYGFPWAVLNGKMWAHNQPSERHSKTLCFTLKDVNLEGWHRPCPGLFQCPSQGPDPRFTYLYQYSVMPHNNLGCKFPDGPIYRWKWLRVSRVRSGTAGTEIQVILWQKEVVKKGLWS